MYIDDDKFIDQLRKEANDVKSCFTTFAFQAIAFSAFVLGAIINLQQDHPYVGFAGVLVIVVTLAVCRIGNYKYATANRHFGFELYLDFRFSKSKKKHLKKLGWEEAMRAWRVVQATIFDHYFYSKTNTTFFELKKKLDYNKIRKERIEQDKPDKWWFYPKDYINSMAKWYPGSYLHTMQDILLLFAYISIIPLFIMALQFQFDCSFNNYFLNKFLWGKLSALFLISCFFILITIMSLLLYRIRILARRNLLEHGVLSIHSCAIMWEAVINAHFMALKKSKNHQNDYLSNLAKEAEYLKDNMDEIYG